MFKRVASLNGHITKVHAGAPKDSDSDIQSVMQQLRDLEKQTLPQTVREAPVNALNTLRLPQTVESLPETVASVPVADLNVAGESVKIEDVNLELSVVKLADSSVDGVVKHYEVLQRKAGDVRWYVCSYCGKEFKKPSDLIRHIRVHTRERPFKVRFCEISLFLNIIA